MYRLISLILLVGCGTPAYRARLDMGALEATRRVRSEAAARGFKVTGHHGPTPKVRVTVPVAQVVWSPDGAVLAIAGLETLQLLTAEGARTLRITPKLQSPPRLRWREGQLWMYGPSRVLVWQRGQDELTHPASPRDEVFPVRPDRAWALAWHQEEIYAHRWGGRRWIRQTRPVHEGARIAAFGPHALYVVAEGRVEMIDLDSGERHRTAPWSTLAQAPSRALAGARKLWIAGERVFLLTGSHLYRWALDGSGGIALRVDSGDQIVDAFASDTRLWIIDRVQGLRVYALDEATAAEPAVVVERQAGVRAMAHDPARGRVAVVRGDGVWVQSASAAWVRRADTPRLNADVAITEDAAGHAWVMGLTGAHAPLPILNGVGQRVDTGLRPGGGALELVPHAGLHMQGDDVSPILGASVRLSPWVLGEGGDTPTASRQHLFMPSLKVGFETRVSESQAEVDLRVALPLVYRTQRAATYGGQLYTDGLPLMLAVEPTLRPLSMDLELEVSAGTEQWGGLFARVGYERASGTPYAQFGAELGRKPTLVVVGGLLLAGLIYGLSQAEYDGVCFRCGEQWQ